MKKKFLVVLAICAVSFSLSTGIASAKSKSGDLGDKLFKKMYIALKEKKDLKLSDSQVDEIVNLKVETKKDYTIKKAEIKNIGLDLKLQLMKDDIDTEKINSLIDEKYDLKKDKAKALIKAYASFKDILSKEQTERLKEIYKKKCLMKNYGNKRKMMKNKMMERDHQMMKDNRMMDMYRR
ncbi:MAG: hypothetical protein K9M01_04660 [Candidatus Omnitrophica bacterium]|nr:hypothetical protein [Candidatus Omnitrophota bacterium]